MTGVTCVNTKEEMLRPIHGLWQGNKILDSLLYDFLAVYLLV